MILLIICMLGSIKLVNYEKCFSSNLKRIFKSDYNYKTYDEFVPKTKKQILGNFPAEIIKICLGKNKKNNIKLFQDAFADTAVYIRECFHEFKKNNIISKDFEDLDKKDLKLFEQNINKIFNGKLKGVLPKGVKAKFEYEGRGMWKNVFKFSLQEYGQKIMHDKAIQVFHNSTCPIEVLKTSQGVYAEANFWTYLKNIAGHKLDKTQFTRHYISDLKNGYSMTEFVDSEIHKTTKPLDIEKLFRIFYTDVTNIPINEKLYDIGGCLKMPGFIKDKVTMKYYKKLMHRSPGKDLNLFIENLKSLVQNPKTPHKDKIQKALELFEHENNPN